MMNGVTTLVRLKEVNTMSKISRLMTYLRNSRPVSDLPFESYYGTLASRDPQSAPSAAEARRDFERMRRVLDRAYFY